jgi:hypothetical protein
MEHKWKADSKHFNPAAMTGGKRAIAAQFSGQLRFF